MLSFAKKWLITVLKEARIKFKLKLTYILNLIFGEQYDIHSLVFGKKISERSAAFKVVMLPVNLL